MFFSVLFGFPVVTFLLMRDTAPGHLRPVHPFWTTLRTTAAVISGSAAFYAFAALPLAQVYAILFAAPLLITVLAIPLLGERVGIRRGLAVLVGLGGVFVVLQTGSNGADTGPCRGADRGGHGGLSHRSSCARSDRTSGRSS